jgi:hypothetical protein
MFSENTRVAVALPATGKDTSRGELIGYPAKLLHAGWGKLVKF